MYIFIYIIQVEIKGNDTNFTRLSFTEAFPSHDIHTVLQSPLLFDIPIKYRMVGLAVTEQKIYVIYLIESDTSISQI